MKNIKVYTALLLLSSIFYSCNYSPPEPADDPTNPRIPPVAGNADFSKYVAVGNSLTAGFMDNALYLEGQQNAYPVILADRMKSVNGGAAFNFPAYGVAGGAGFGGSFVPGSATPIGRYQFILPNCSNPDQTKSLGITPAPTIPGEPLALYAGNKSELNNFGVPGAKIFHTLVPGYGASPTAGNPFYWRFASASTATLLGDAVAAKGTFFTYWLGNNDVLSYATSGGSGNPNPGTNPLTYGSNDMTDPLVFALVLKSSLDALFSVGANTKGAIATIPNVVNIPYFRLINEGLTIGVNAPLPFNLSADDAAALNAAYARHPAAAEVNFKAGKVNYPVIATGDGLRHMDPAKDFLTLVTPQDSLLAGPISLCNPAPRAKWGITKPIPGQYVLDQTEVNLVTQRVAAYNNIIRQEAASRPTALALVDIQAYLADLEARYITLAPPFGYFSLDGVHPNPRGQAAIANEFIKAINAKFSSTLPQANIANYRMNKLPVQ